MMHITPRTVLSHTRHILDTMKPTAEELVRYRICLQTGQWFSNIPVVLQDALLEAAVIRTLAAGEFLFARGDPYDGLHVPLTGAIRISGVSAAGKEALLTLMQPPHWFGEMALFDGLARSHDAIAEAPSTVLRVPGAALAKLLREQPSYWREFGVLLSHKLRLAFATMEDIALLPAPMRLVRRLLLIAERYGDWQGRSSRVIGVQQEKLAAMLSLSRQTTNQILKELEGQGLIRTARGEIEILDMPRLRAIAALGT